MAGRLSSKVVIVTGGSTGIGRAVADRVVAEGGAVVIAGRRREPGERAAAELRAGGGRARFVATDVTVEHEVQRLVEAAVDEFGRLDGALNNAGGVNATAPLPGVDAGTWQADLAQNLTSVFYCLKYQIPAMTESAGGGSIINNASIGGVRGLPGLAPYVAAKHGVVGLTPLRGTGRSGPRDPGQRAGHRQRGHAALPGPDWCPAGRRAARTRTEPDRPGRHRRRDRVVRDLPAQ
jgi:NAD(P)-dependent dehydrogenase (short-subunit alcohol dehydrogenase family)